MIYVVIDDTHAIVAAGRTIVALSLN